MVLEKNKVVILLAAYNGEKYIKEQLDSILMQSYKNFTIIIRDDGSVDATKKIINEYKLNNQKIMHILDDDGKNRGASDSFAFLLQYVLLHKMKLGLEQFYIMFSDQDDVWRRDKIEIEILEMQRAEVKSKDMPILIHSDLKVTLSDGTKVADSFMNYQGLQASKNKFRHQLITNTVTGCTILINEALARKALPISENAIMHDWWLSLCAAAFGQLIYLPMPLVEYRQHENNAIGAKEYFQSKIFSRKTISKIFNFEPSQILNEVVIQSSFFYKIYRKDLTLKQKFELFFVKKLNTKHALFQRCIYRLLRL